mmetsp:Transcript_37886/g.60793  ORF Transcript_37886/g.60793 Transcript_37886/m.60793 type:complete len:362 (-) Transcript_37886:157-1242(-)
MLLRTCLFLLASSAAASAKTPYSAGLSMNCVNFEGGLRLTVDVAIDGKSSQECLLDTGSSTLAFCDASLESGLESLKTDYMSCNLYGSGNEGYWGFFYKGGIGVGGQVNIDSAYYSIMHQEVSMPCGSGLQGIFGVAFKLLDQAAVHPGALNWPSGGVGNCPQPSTDLVGPLMSYLKQDTPSGRLGIYWSGAVGSGTGELYVGPSAESNSHYSSGTAQIATLGETGYYDITINSFSFAGQTHSDIQCNFNAGSPCLVDTGTPIMFVPSGVYQAIMNGQTGSLEMQLAGPSGTATLKFDAQTLANNQYIAPYQGGPYIIGLPLWAFYYTVFNVDGRTMALVEHSPSELSALKNQRKNRTIVV